MTDIRYRLPNEVAVQLQVSPSTLRRWSNEFGDFLSDAAGRPQSASGGQTAHRRYSDEDMETLLNIKGLLDEGLTYIQVGRRLEALRLRRTMGEGQPQSGEEQTTALGPAVLDTTSVAPAVTVLADTLHTVADGQQLLLGSQQANRELITVVLQDNFGLKEENAKLRDRMLDLERELAEIRRLDDQRREAMEARLRQIEAKTQPVSPVRPPSQPKQRSGCLGQLFGS
jgi:DNA-binding transcriptional MerR regulator